MALVRVAEGGVSVTGGGIGVARTGAARAAATYGPKPATPTMLRLDGDARLVGAVARASYEDLLAGCHTAATRAWRGSVVTVSEDPTQPVVAAVWRSRGCPAALRQDRRGRPARTRGA